jgi:3-oxoacyl-[acyl-carrier protein] reductase
MLTSIKGRVVIVTGASKGIGKGIARVFARHGAKVLVVSRNLVEATACATELGGEAIAFAADIATWEGAQAMARAATDQFGAIDILCANAGTFPQTRIEDMDPDEWDSVMAINLKGAFLCVKACLPWLRQSNQGRVVLTSSITGPVTGYPGWSHYGASKAGQLGFMRTAALELARHRITINAVLPGNVVTEGLADLGEDYLATMAASIPLRALGSVEDIGHAALFFASKEAAYITGQTLVVDGGQILPETLEALDA